MNNHETRIEDLERHADIANGEMGKVHIQLATHSTILESLVKAVDKLDARLWWVLGSIIVMGLANIAFR